MYEARFTTKQIYDNYKNAVGNTTPKPTTTSKQRPGWRIYQEYTDRGYVPTNIATSVASSKSTSRSTPTVETRSDSYRKYRDRKGSTYDEVPQSLVQKPEPKPVKETAYEKVLRVFNEAMEGFGVFDEPTQPTYDTVDTMNVYKDKRYFGPKVYSPDIDFKDPSLEDVSPKIFKDFNLPSIYKDLNTDKLPTLPESTTNILGVDTENPLLNRFGVGNKTDKPPAPLMSPPSVEVPANMDPITRTLSQAMIPQAPPVMVNYEVGSFRDTENLMTIVEDLNREGVDITLEELAKANDLPVNPDGSPVDPFVQKGEVIKVPMPSTDAAPKEVKAALEKLTPITMTEDKSLLEQLKESTEYYKKLAADALGIDIETDESKIKTAVGLGSKQYKVKKGDTLFKIARANGITLSEILKANPNINPDKLSIGDTIKLPKVGAAIDTLSEIKTIQVPDGNLKISTGTRSDHPTGLKISLDYNSAANPNAKGTLVVIPDNASQAVRDAAEKFNDLVVQFAASKGYEDYENRGVRTRSENKRGVSNTIHVEPFFQQDSKMEQIINENFAEFAKLYTEAFGEIDANMIAPHGNINSKGIQDKGATSKVFGTELDFGNRLIKELMDN